jgi:hypothetical protein
MVKARLLETQFPCLNHPGCAGPRGKRAGKFVGSIARALRHSLTFLSVSTIRKGDEREPKSLPCTHRSKRRSPKVKLGLQKSPPFSLW